MNNVLLNVLRSSMRATLRNEYRKSEICTMQCGFLSAARKLATKVDSATGAAPKKKTKEVPKITLFQQNQAVSITTLEEAQKLARRRDLRLIKLLDCDPKSQRPVYRLATTAELLEEDPNTVKFQSSASSVSRKSDKSLTINTRISDNDLLSRLKNITKWLTKGHEVRVLIQGNTDNTKDSERIVQKIETTLKEPQLIGRITQKRSKDGIIRFSIIPASASSDKEDDEQA